MARNLDWLLTLNSDGSLTILPELLTISEFSKLWSKKDKSKAIKELSYVAFYCNYSSPYNQVVSSESYKRQLIGKDIMGDKSYIPTKEVQNCINKYMEMNITFSMEYLDSAKEAARKVIEYYKDVDFKETTRTGGLVNKPSDVVRSIASSTDMLSAISKWEEKVRQEKEMLDDRITGGGTIGEYED